MTCFIRQKQLVCLGGKSSSFAHSYMCFVTHIQSVLDLITVYVHLLCSYMHLQYVTIIFETLVDLLYRVLPGRGIVHNTFTKAYHEARPHSLR